MPTKDTISLRINTDTLAWLDRVAARDYEGNRSMALRAVLRLGLAATADQAAGKQPPKQTA